MRHNILLHAVIGFSIQFLIGLLTHPSLGLMSVVVMAWLEEEYARTSLELPTKESWATCITMAGATVGQLALWQLAPYL